MTDGALSRSFHFATRIGPRWSNIERMRTAVLSGAQAVFGQDDISEVVGTITSELMENAVKYGDWRPPDRVWMKVEVTTEESALRIDVECPVDERSEHFQNLLQMLQWIESFPSPQDAYLTRIQVIAERGPDDGASGLGLVRMACEGPCRLCAKVVEGGVLVMSAVLELPPEALSEPGE